MYRLFQKGREPFSSYSHFLGAVGSGIGLLIILFHCLINQDVTVKTAISTLLFCLSLIALYTSSSVYHFSLQGEEILLKLKKLDHAMIYILIAGSYTPVILKYMPEPRSFMFLGIIWLIAILGIVVKLLWINAPRFIGTILYLGLGWAILADVQVLLSMPTLAIILLAAGGISYTIGGVIYILKWPNPSKTVGFHELFHIFVLGGSLFHFLMVYLFVI